MTLEPDLVLDCRGLPCPLPVIRLAQRIAEVPLWGLVLVESDDPAARADVQAWCRMRHQEYVGEQLAADGVSGYAVRRLM